MWRFARKVLEDRLRKVMVRKEYECDGLLEEAVKEWKWMEGFRRWSGGHAVVKVEGCDCGRSMRWNVKVRRTESKE